MSNKVLITLGVIQTLALAFLVFGARSGARPAPSTTFDRLSMPAEGSVSPGAADSGLPMDDLRLLIREELSRRPADDQGQPSPRNFAEDQLRRSKVEVAIAGYRRSGVITWDQLQELQREIALLDRAGEETASRVLGPALNSGEIRVRR